MGTVSPIPFHTPQIRALEFNSRLKHRTNPCTNPTTTRHRAAVQSLAISERLALTSHHLSPFDRAHRAERRGWEQDPIAPLTPGRTNLVAPHRRKGRCGGAEGFGIDAGYSDGGKEGCDEAMGLVEASQELSEDVKLLADLNSG